MSNEVEVPKGDSAKDTATLLLAAAEELEQDPAVVRVRDGNFIVPQDVAEKAGLDHEEVQPVGTPRVGERQPKQEGDDSNAPEPVSEEKPPAKKAAAKKSAKKTAPKKG